MTKDMRVNKITDSGNVQTGNRFNRLFLNPLVVIWKGETSVDCDEETGMERLRSSFESLEEDACRVS